MDTSGGRFCSGSSISQSSTATSLKQIDPPEIEYDCSECVDFSPDRIQKTIDQAGLYDHFGKLIPIQVRSEWDFYRSQTP